MAKSGAGRRLIIHCGVQKTGSTSFHHFVARNRAALSGHVALLTPQRGSPTRDLGRTAMRFSLSPDDEGLRAQLSGLARSLRDDLPGDGTPVILSHENLPGAMIGKDGVTTLYPMLDRIVVILEQGFAPLIPEFVFYTRDMAAWKSSVYNQAVRSDHYTGTRGEFLTETRDCGDWDGLRDRMVQLAGTDRVRFFRLEGETDPARPGQQLLRHAGVPAEVLSALSAMDRPANQSLNAGALEFLRLVNGLGLKRPERSRVVHLVSANQSLFAAGAV
jgi:hypothetical protein